MKRERFLIVSLSKISFSPLVTRLHFIRIFRLRLICKIFRRRSNIRPESIKPSGFIEERLNTNENYLGKLVD